MERVYIGADIGGTSIKLGVLDVCGTIIARKEISYRELIGSGGEGPGVMDVLIDGIRKILAEYGESDTDTHAELEGIGISAAGCINSFSGTVAGNGGNIPDWSWTEACGILINEFGVPCTMANDANCAILGEQWKGAAEGLSDVVGVTLGTGVGGGIITGGRLLEGSRGYAGEIGHFPTHAGGEKCVCGLDGCYERYASTSALIRRSSEADPEWKDGRAFFAAAEAGNEAAKSILDEWISEIAYGITGLVHLFDPRMILIGGGVSAQRELLIEPLKEKVLSMVMPDFADGLEFRPAMLGNDAGITGAVRYLIDHLEQKTDK